MPIRHHRHTENSLPLRNRHRIRRVPFHHILQGLSRKAPTQRYISGQGQKTLFPVIIGDGQQTILAMPHHGEKSTPGGTNRRNLNDCRLQKFDIALAIVEERRFQRCNGNIRSGKHAQIVAIGQLSEPLYTVSELIKVTRKLELTNDPQT